jgi:hypothetical protein
MMESYWVLGGTPPQGFKSPYPAEDQKIRAVEPASAPLAAR